MTTPVGRIEIPVEPDVSGFPRRMRAELTAAAVVAANEGRSAGKAYGDELAKGASDGVTRLTRDAQGKLRNSRGQFATDAEKAAAGISDVFSRKGEESGGLLARGVRSGIMRNSPLIVAAVTAALAVGAPVAVLGATTLFGGIGAVAAAQSQRVRSAWVATWDGIKSGAVADAQVLVPTYERMATRIGSAFQDLRPQLRATFEASAPQADMLTDSIIRLANNAMPGLVRAVERGNPIVAGFGNFLEDTGTGLTGFFDNITDHAPEAGQALDSLGDVIGTTLPLLGETLGQGAELAAIGLPLLSHGLGLVLTVAEALGPALPPLAAGFLALKAAQAVGGWIGGLGTRLDDFAAKGGLAAGAAGRVGGGLGAISAAAGPVGIAVGVVAGVMALGEQQALDYATALKSGGEAADDVRGMLKGVRSVMDENDSSLASMALNWNLFATRQKQALEEGEEAYNDYYDSLTPVAQAQAKVAEWSNTLSDRLEDESSSTGEVEAAKRRLAYWQAEAARLADDEARAIRGVTEAMEEQANQARARVDANFAFEQSLNGIEDAQAAYTEAVKEHGPASEEAQRAALALNMAYDESVAAAGRMAQSNLPASLDDTQRAILGAKAELDRLNQLISEGVELPPSMEAYRQQLISITGQADGAMLAQAQLAAAVGELGFAVNAVPGEKHITITAPTDEVRARLAELGFTIVELPSGDIKVTAETEEAKAHLGTLSADLVGLNNTTATPTAALNAAPFEAARQFVLGALGGLAAQQPTPVAGLNIAPLQGQTQTSFNLLGSLAQQRPTPEARLTDFVSAAARSARDAILDIPLFRNSTVTITTVQKFAGASASSSLKLATGGLPGRLIRGPGTGTSDTAGLFALSNYEYVNREAIVRRVGVPTFDAINRGDWAAVAARFTELSQTQSRAAMAALASTRAAAAAGRLAAGGLPERAREEALTANRPAPQIQQNVYPSAGMDEVGLADRALRQLEILGRTPR